MSLRYIGSKARIAQAIVQRIGQPNGGVLVDAFSGTGAVAHAASREGWRVLVNDHLTSSAVTSFARVVARPDLQFSAVGGYESAIERLNRVTPRAGFIWREYSPASSRHCSTARMYFTEPNARRIDGVRRRIALWKHHDLIGDAEERVLIADLLAAANRVANTAGTYGCFLSKWQRQSLEHLVLVPRQLPEAAPASRMTTRDALDVECTPEDTVYLDPPYTKRQYAAYYHILETVALGDEPLVEGVCGIRPWRNWASPYCYKLRAAEALKKLVQALPSQRVFLSYSTEGHVSLTLLLSLLQDAGRVEMIEIDRVSRYRPNRAACEAGAEVGEVLFCIEKSGQRSERSEG